MPELDRGFTDGLQLFATSVNGAGGICGRSLTFTPSGPTEALTEPDDRYPPLARRTLGLVTLLDRMAATAFAGTLSADQLPVLAPEGTRAPAGHTRPLIVGATDDVLILNALAHLISTERIQSGQNVAAFLGAEPDPSVTAALQWWSQRTGVSILTNPDDESLRTVAAAVVLDRPAQVNRVLELLHPSAGEATTPTVTTTGSPTTSVGEQRPMVITTLDGFDPGTTQTVTAQYLWVSTVTPAITADQPTAQAVLAAATDARLEVQPRLIEGFAIAGSWARALRQMCSDRSLTRTGFAAAMRTLGPDDEESLFGGTDPTRQFESGRPASLSSAISTPDPTAPGGLRVVTTLQSPSAVADYWDS